MVLALVDKAVLVFEKIETVIKSLLTKTCPVPDGCYAEFYQNHKEELIPILLKVVHII